MAPPQPWTTTKLDDHENCPRMFEGKHVTKAYVEDYPVEQRDWGRHVHSAFEHYLKHGTALPVDLQQHAGYLDSLKAMPGVLAAEEKIALDNQLRPCGYFAKNVTIWFRSAMDVRIRNHAALTSHVVDHKTGKPHSKFRQLQAFALYEFVTQPWVETVRAEFYWTQTRSVTGETYHRANIGALWAELLPPLTRFANAFLEDNWPAKQSGLCRGWCPVTDCEFWSPKRPAR